MPELHYCHLKKFFVPMLHYALTAISYSDIKGDVDNTTPGFLLLHAMQLPITAGGLKMHQ